MNGYSSPQGLSEEDFGPSNSGLKAFDAFPKTKPTYQTATRTGAAWTLLVLVLSAWLSVTETARWWRGTTTHTFSVEKAVSSDMQINVDVVVAMTCKDLHVNLQDASGDRVLAGDKLRKDGTNWASWLPGKTGGREALRQRDEVMWGMGVEEDVHDFLGAKKGKKRFPKAPRIRGVPDACRIYGSLEGNKVQGDLHITARGHGYMEFGEHLDHNSFNFSHIINELSFGPYYPSLTNPLDNTFATTPHHFYKFQYYLSIVPTIYTESPAALAALDAASSTDALAPASHQRLLASSNTILTNQYSATSQERPVPENQVPGLFVKFDIEPITLTVVEERPSFLAYLARLVNVVAGVMVAGGWCTQLGEWAVDVWGRRRRARVGEGLLDKGVVGEKE